MIRQIAVIGTGTMGRGIAYLSATSGFETVIYDLDQAALDGARAWIDSTLRKGVEKGRLDEAAAAAASKRVHLVPDLEPAVRSVDLIIEAVPENLQLKTDLFAQADLFCPEETILASNTSSISISRLAGNVERRDRFVGLHFFNPPHVMKLLEIVRGERTSDQTIDQMLDLAAKFSKEAIVVRDSPGFATSRLGVAIGLEAIRMLEEGVASAADIDKAMELGYNHPMGPLRLTDLIGLDVRLGIAEYLARPIRSVRRSGPMGPLRLTDLIGLDVRLGIAEYLAGALGPRFDPPQLLRDMVAAGKLGRKTGSGFYDWSEDQ